MRRFLITAFLLLPTLAFAQSVYGEAIIATEKALQTAAELVEQHRQDLLLGKKTDLIHTKVLEAARGFNTASMELEAERKKLSANPSGNKERLQQLAETRKEADVTKARIKKLLSMVDKPKECVAAVKSGTLERLLEETASATKKMAGQNEAVNEGLKADARGAGSFEIKELPGGNLKLWLVTRDGEEPLAKRTYPVTALPLVFRVCVMDEHKTRLTEQKKNPPGSISFEEVKGMLPSHAFEFGNATVSSRWDVEERYSFTPVGNTGSRIGGLRQRASDEATRADHGDLIELSPASDLAQDLSFDVEGTVVKWKRKTRGKGEDVIPKDASTKGRLVLSIYPK